VVVETNAILVKDKQPKK